MGFFSARLRLFSESPLQGSLQAASKPQVTSISVCRKIYIHGGMLLLCCTNVGHGMSLLRWNKKKVFWKSKWGDEAHCPQSKRKFCCLIFQSTNVLDCYFAGKLRSLMCRKNIYMELFMQKFSLHFKFQFIL